MIRILFHSLAAWCSCNKKWFGGPGSLDGSDWSMLLFQLPYQLKWPLWLAYSSRPCAHCAPLALICDTFMCLPMRDCYCYYVNMDEFVVGTSNGTWWRLKKKTVALEPMWVMAFHQSGDLAIITKRVYLNEVILRLRYDQHVEHSKVCTAPLAWDRLLFTPKSPSETLHGRIFLVNR